MTYSAKIISDSTADDVRLTTLEVVMPRIILAEFNTHRVFSRNSASSRAIPVERRVKQVAQSPFVPEAFLLNQKGMVAGGALDENSQIEARTIWLDACQEMTRLAAKLAAVGVHKQWANRLLEPFGWHTVVVTATEWENFFALRTHKDAQPEIQEVARLMKAAMDASKPEPLQIGDWHLPYVTGDELAKYHTEHGKITLIRLSVARCAAVSYERQQLVDLEADMARYDRLHASGHMSPFEHQAQVLESDASQKTGSFIGNFRLPFLQYRKTLKGEAVWSAP